MLVMLPAHLAATFVWTVWLYAEEGRRLSPAVIVDTIEWAVFGYYVLVLLLVPTVVYLAVLWIARRAMRQRLPQRLAVLLGIAVMWTVATAWWTIANGQAPNFGIYPINAVAWLVIFPAVLGLLVGMPPACSRPRGDIPAP